MIKTIIAVIIRLGGRIKDRITLEESIDMD